MKSLLVRKVPAEVQAWIEKQRQQHGMSQQEFIISLLKFVSESPQVMQAAPLPFYRQSAEGERPSDGELPFRFVDLFAGIGGFRIALERIGGQCVFSSEFDRYCQRTYKAWFGEIPKGDVREIRPADIPDHDILAAGFPCQPFSIAGVSKKKSLGHAHGFKCATQGTLFFNIASIVEVKRPPILLLENVKNLLSHDEGRTWAVITETLRSLRYTVFHRVIDASGWVPQHRERIYIVCFDRDVFGDSPPFQFPGPPAKRLYNLRELLEPAAEPKYTLSNHLWKYLKRYAERHRKKGNGFGFGLADLEGITRTLSSRYYKDGSEILIPQRGRNPRRLTPRECARLMGFDDQFRVVVSDTQAYRQFGNAVVPQVVEAVGRELLKVLKWQLARGRNGCLLKAGSSTVGRSAPAGRP